MKPVLSRLALLALALPASTGVCALDTVSYARQGNLLTLEYRWTGEGLQARIPSGTALWTFDPASREFRRAPAPLAAAPACRADGLPASVAPLRILQFDRNADSHIDAAVGDSARLYFAASVQSQSQWFALDVSDPYAPSVSWVDTARQLPGLGAIASAPAFARLDVGSGRNADAQKFVVLFGAGSGASAAGPKIYAVDARNGVLLWSAGNANASLVLAALRAEFTGGIAPVDVDGDGYVDRLYAGDDAGALWRFDLHNGRDPTALGSGGVIARVDGALRGMPDVALLEQPGASPQFAITLTTATAASVSREPRSAGWLYSLRDAQPFAVFEQADFARLMPVTPAQLRLVDKALAAPGAGATPGSSGWRMPLAPGEWLAAATLTADGRLLFSTFIGDAASQACQPRGENRVYILWLDDADAATDLNADGTVSPLDRSRRLAQRELVQGVEVKLAAPGAPDAGNATCTAGSEALPGCLRPFAPRRTYWFRNDAD